MGLLPHWPAFRHNISLPNKIAFVLVSAVLLAGCGDVFRPVANPLPRAGGDPAAAGEAIVLSGNGALAGTTTHINTSGDTVVAIEHVGVNPIHAIIIGSAVVVANQGDGTNLPTSTISSYPLSAGPAASVSFFSVPVPDDRPGTIPQPTFLATTDNANIYLAEQGSNVVGVIPVSTLSPGSSTCTAMQPAPCVIVDSSIVTPVGIAQLPGGGKVYVANQGSNQVTVIDPATLAVKTTVNVGNSPSAIVASPDGNCVYVANQNSGTVSVITTSNDMPTATAITVGAGPVSLRFDPLLQRLYVVNNAGGSVSVISHATDCSSTLLKTVGVGLAPKSIAALSDKTRAYVANSGDGTVSVIDVNSNTVRKTIAVGGSPQSIGASADGTKVVVAANTSVVVIRTTDDTMIQQVNFMPQGTAPNPRFVLMNP